MRSFARTIGICRPSKRERSIRLHFLHDNLKFGVLMARIRAVSSNRLPWHEWPIQLSVEPRTKFAVIDQRSPYAPNRGGKLDSLFNAISHRQPPGCLSLSQSLEVMQSYRCRYGVV